MEFILYTFATLNIEVLYGCASEKMENEDLLKKQGVEYSPERDAQIQQYNLERQKDLVANRYHCDVTL
jgi:hypothetical protein